jgi:hypothetical protein
VAISSVALGDLVVASDPQTGQTEARPVVALIHHGGAHNMVDLSFEDGSKLSATAGHPFWDASRGDFVDAGDLVVGEQVLAADGSLLRITVARHYVADVVAYNFEVQDLHTYYAGATPVLVHNCGGLPAELLGGPANVSVYKGIVGAKDVYSGITNNILRRTLQHGPRFDDVVEIGSGLLRGEARSIEQALINRNLGENIRNSISPLHDYYDDAVRWGEQWLKSNGL